MMITCRCKTLFTKSLMYHPKTPFAYSLLYSSQTQKIPEKSNVISDYFVKEHQFSSEVAMKAASSLTHLKTPAKCDEVLSFFKGIGFSSLDLQKIVGSSSSPTVLCANLDNTLKPKIKSFQDLGFSNDDVVSIVSSNPWLLLRSANNRILPSLLVLKNVLGSVDLVAKLLKVSAWFLKCDLDNTLVQNIEFLKSCGIQLEQLIQHIYNQLRLFLHKPDSLKKLVVRVDEMRFPKESKMYLYAITCLSSMSEVNFERKLELFRSLGFTDDQIGEMFQKEPSAFQRSQGKIKEVVQAVSGSLIYGLSDIVGHPRVFANSVEKRLKPRLQVLEILLNRNLISKHPSFSVMCVSTDMIFINKFVAPYLDELGDIYWPSTPLVEKGHSAGNHLLISSNHPMAKSPLCNSGLSRSFCCHASSQFDDEGPAAIDCRSRLQPDDYQRLAYSTLHNLQDKLEVSF